MGRKTSSEKSFPTVSRQAVTASGAGTLNRALRFGLISLVGIYVLLVIYGPALEGPFLFDDNILPYGSYRYHSLPLVSWVSGLRPALMFSYWLDFKLSENHTLTYHVSNILLHAANAWLVWYLLRHLFPKRLVLCALGTGIFLCHPLQTESVAYLAGRSELLCGFFVLSSALVFLKSSRVMSWKRAIGLMLLAGIALLSKEQALALWVWFILIETGWLEKAPALLPALRANIRNHRRLYLLALFGGMWGIWNVYGVLRNAKSAGFGLPDLPWYAYFWTECRVIFLYIRLFFVPIGQSVVPNVAVSHGPTEHGAIMGLAALLILGWAAFRLRRKMPIATFGFLTFLVLIAPTSSFVPLADVMAEHRMYLPILGVILICIGALSQVEMRPATAVVATGAIVSVLCLMTLHRSRVWGSADALAEDTVVKSPFRRRGYFMLGSAYLSEKRYAELVRRFSAAPKGLLEGDSRLLTGWGVAYECLGKYTEALALFRRADAMRADPYLLSQIGLTEGRIGNASESLRAFNRAIEIAPDFYLPYCYRGYWHLAAKEYPAAETDFQRALALNPNEQSAREGLASTMEARRMSRVGTGGEGSP